MFVFPQSDSGLIRKVDQKVVFKVLAVMFVGSVQISRDVAAL